jgi:hypothetical protein
MNDTLKAALLEALKKDLGGVNSRFKNGTIDRGAYEY